MTFYCHRFTASACDLGVVVDTEDRLVHLEFLSADEAMRPALERFFPEDDLLEDPSRTAPVEDQLREYFAGDRQGFDLELAPRGTEFQQAVWRQMLAIPPGETLSYSAIAQKLGRPGAARAVGRASATNPIPVVVPCHRVVGADGSLTGFGGGLPLKRLLLKLEGAAVVEQQAVEQQVFEQQVFEQQVFEQQVFEQQSLELRPPAPPPPARR